MPTVFGAPRLLRVPQSKKGKGLFLNRKAKEFFYGKGSLASWINAHQCSAKPQFCGLEPEVFRGTGGIDGSKFRNDAVSHIGDDNKDRGLCAKCRVGAGITKRLLKLFVINDVKASRLLVARRRRQHGGAKKCHHLTFGHRFVRKCPDTGPTLKNVHQGLLFAFPRYAATLDSMLPRVACKEGFQTVQG